MKNRWTLHVEDFGNIRSADIEVAPLMLFVGENNTGKSYIASLLWGILEYWILPRSQKIPADKNYKRCKELLIEHYKEKKKQATKELIDAILVWFNKVLDNKKNELIDRIFSCKDLEIGQLSIINFQCSMPLLIEWNEKMEYKGNIPGNRQLYSMLLNLMSKLIKMNMLYLPASRTGFMLSYKTLVSELMEVWGEEVEIKSKFSLPIIRFLQRLIKSEISLESKYADIAKSLENNILKGKIIQKSELIPDFSYIPGSSQISLPFHVSSWLVTELAPLIIFLKDRLSKFDSLVFEEPESHLHLEAQRILAKHLVKLVNRGLPVWITTHSDIMFQQFNNLIGTSEERIQKLKNLSYQDDEIIKPEDIKAYQFNVAEDGKTDVVSLKLTDDGFPASNFNHTLWDLSKESMSLEAD